MLVQPAVGLGGWSAVHVCVLLAVAQSAADGRASDWRRLRGRVELRQRGECDENNKRGFSLLRLLSLTASAQPIESDGVWCVWGA